LTPRWKRCRIRLGGETMDTAAWKACDEAIAQATKAHDEAVA